MASRWFDFHRPLFGDVAADPLNFDQGVVVIEDGLIVPLHPADRAVGAPPDVPGCRGDARRRSFQFANASQPGRRRGSEVMLVPASLPASGRNSGSRPRWLQSERAVRRQRHQVGLSFDDGPVARFAELSNSSVCLRSGDVEHGEGDAFEPNRRH